MPPREPMIIGAEDRILVTGSTGFLGAIVEGAEVPISYGEILRMARIMDSIFEQVGASVR